MHIYYNTKVVLPTYIYQICALYVCDVMNFSLVGLADAATHVAYCIHFLWGFTCICKQAYVSEFLQLGHLHYTFKRQNVWLGSSDARKAYFIQYSHLYVCMYLVGT